MNVPARSPDPASGKDLQNPMFIAWLKYQLRGAILESDDQDFEDMLAVSTSRQGRRRSLSVGSRDEIIANVRDVEGKTELSHAYDQGQDWPING
jgi:hypothetical protein